MAVSFLNLCVSIVMDRTTTPSNSSSGFTVARSTVTTLLGALVALAAASGTADGCSSAVAVTRTACLPLNAANLFLDATLNGKHTG